MMRIAVLGAGAMGSLFGGYLSGAGHETWLIDVRTDLVARLNDSGLAIVGPDGARRVVAVRATTEPSTVGQVDLVIVFVKCFDTDSALRGALPLLGPETVVLSLQNGLGNGDVIAERVGGGRLLLGVTYNSATAIAPAEIRHTNAGRTAIGEPGCGVSRRVEAVVEAIASSGLEVEAASDVMSMIWTKLTLNAGCLGAAALTRMTAGEQAAHPGVAAVIRELVTETVAVARAAGHRVLYDDPPRDVLAFLAKAGPAKASMLQDVEAGRRTEVGVINGAVVAEGRRRAVATPANALIAHLVEGLETHIQAERQESAVL